MPTISSVQLGQHGEALAARELKRLGYRILEQNYRAGRWGELDFVCVEQDDLVFVEVKTRSDASYGLPVEAVSYGKRQRLRRAAEYYKLTHPGVPDSLRFDVMALFPFRHSAGFNVELYRNIDVE